MGWLLEIIGIGFINLGKWFSCRALERTKTQAKFSSPFLKTGTYKLSEFWGTVFCFVSGHRLHDSHAEILARRAFQRYDQLSWHFALSLAELI